MVNLAAQNEREEEALPIGRSIFDLITSNDLEAIRSILNPLTLRARQIIVYQKIEHKTLLYYACELGFNNIVKYLLDECGADIDDGYCEFVSESPLTITLYRLDINLMTLLMRRRVTVLPNNRDTNSVDYASNNRFNSLVTILNVYDKRNNGITLIKPRSRGKYNSGLFRFSEKGKTEYKRRNRIYLNAVIYGSTHTVKMILTRGVNRNCQNNEDENALCLAILNGQKNTENFLINYKTCTLKSYALALELCGAKFIVFRSEARKGLECWTKSVKIRQGYRVGFSDKDQLNTESNLGIEFQTEEEIYALQVKHMYLQALLVFLRLLQRNNAVTARAFIIVAQHRIFQDDLLFCLRILSELFYSTNINGCMVRYPSDPALQTMDELFRSHFDTGLDDKTEYLLKFEKLFQVLWGVLRMDSNVLYDIAYEELLVYVLSNIEYMNRYNLSQEIQEWIVKEVGSITGNRPSHYPTTLIHEAILRNFPLRVVAWLLKCAGAGANCISRLKNTPLHLVSTLSHRDRYSVQMTNLLIEAGGHIDAVNCFGNRPLERLYERRVIGNPLKYLSLQCFAARAIYKSGIVVPEDNFPKILVRFIRLHSA